MLTGVFSSTTWREADQTISVCKYVFCNIKASIASHILYKSTIPKYNQSCIVTHNTRPSLYQTSACKTTRNLDNTTCMLEQTFFIKGPALTSPMPTGSHARHLTLVVGESPLVSRSLAPWMQTADSGLLPLLNEIPKDSVNDDVYE